MTLGEDGMRKTWLPFAALAVEGSALVWMMGSQAWDWATAVLVGR